MKYFLIGPYPPILGGVSVFNYRYTKVLKQKDYDVENIDLYKKTRVRRYLCYLKLFGWPKKAIYHLDKFVPPIAIVLLLRPFRSKIILHNHSCRYFETLGRVERTILRWFLTKVDECIFISEQLKAYYSQNGFALPIKITIQSPFLPPPLEEEDNIWKTYDSKTLCFVNNHKPLLIANAFQIVFYQGVDLYGLDLCVDLVSELKKIYPQIGLLFALAEIGETKYFEEIVRQIKDKNIDDNFFFMTGQKELWPLFRKCDLMVRPTYSDGYGISIAEALYFNCPAVASNVGGRPEGTVLFRNRDFDDFLGKVKNILVNRKKSQYNFATN